jgi:hypothetical protein
MPARMASTPEIIEAHHWFDDAFDGAVILVGQRHLSTPGSTTSFSGILRISTAIEMVHLEVAGCIRPAISLLHNMRNIPVFIVMGC